MEKIKEGIKSKIKTTSKIFFKALSILGVASSGFIGIIAFMTAIVILICSSVATFPLMEEGLDIKATGNIVDLTSSGGISSSNVEVGARYEWNELAKAELISNNYEKNLYKLCMLFYQALADTGQNTGDNTVRMDSLLATGTVESGMSFFKGAEDNGDILTDLVTANSEGTQYKGTFACSESEVQKYQWDRYKTKGNPLYLPDSVYFLVNEAKNTYASILKVSDDPRGHQYGKYLESAFNEFGLDWNTDVKAKNDVCSMLYYLKHAGGNWNNDWCYSMARYIVYMYTTYLEKDFRNLVVTNVDALNSATLQGYAIGTNTVYGFTMTKENITNIVGKTRGKGVTIPSMFTYKGEEVVDAFSAIYFFNAPKGEEDLKVFNTYADDVYSNGEYGVKSQAVMALLMGVPYASVGQSFMLKAIQSLGYTSEDFTIDEYGYLCYAKNIGNNESTDENTSGGTCVLNEATIKYLGQVISAEATDSQDVNDKEALAEAEAVALTIYNRMMEYYLKSNDYNDAVLSAITASGQFSTVILGDGVNSFTYKGRTYHTTRKSTPVTDLAIKEIFKADVNDPERQKALQNIQKYMDTNPQITDIERIYYFWDKSSGYCPYGDVKVGKMGNCYSYSSSAKYSWLN